jgi:hypothetical protein
MANRESVCLRVTLRSGVDTTEMGRPVRRSAEEMPNSRSPASISRVECHRNTAHAAGATRVLRATLLALF